MTQIHTDNSIGLIGLGVMGRNLALNVAEKGFSIAVYDRDENAVSRAVAEGVSLAGNLTGCGNLEDLVAALPKPRAIILLVPAGGIVDSLIDALTPLLAKDDIIIDAGNTQFHDTQRRTLDVGKSGIHFVGMGVSGGEEGARHGPAMMIGGHKDAFARIRPVMHAIAAHYEGEPCADWVGADGAGHFVKTVHNGIEYGDMQLIAEAYGTMRGPLQMPLSAIADAFEGWRSGALSSYLVDVTAAALRTQDAETQSPIIDVILDKAGQKGTGRWTVIEALHLGQSATIIEAALSARGVSSLKVQRTFAAKVMPRPEGISLEVLRPSNADIADAFLAARILAYSQGFSILQAGSSEYGWDLQMDRIAKVWRAGCIIRSALLNQIAEAYQVGVPEGLLLLAPQFRDALARGLVALRKVVAFNAMTGQAAPAFASALTYLEGMCQERSTANIIQAQRDFFGAHGFERVDREGTFHGDWSNLTH